MAITVKLGATFNSVVGLVDTSLSTKKSIDNGQDARADVVAPLERSCHLLAGRRLVSIGGTTRPHSGAADATFEFRLAREPYCKSLQCVIVCSLTGASNDYDFMTVKLATVEDSTGQSVRVHNQSGTAVGDSRRIIHHVDYGDGTSGNLGTDDATVTFVRSNDGTVRVWSITFSPVDLLEISV